MDYRQKRLCQIPNYRSYILFSQPVGDALIHAISEGLGDRFDSETEAAWHAVFKLIVSVMSTHLPDQQQAEGPLSTSQKRLVQTTWTKLSPDPTQHGSVMFAK